MRIALRWAVVKAIDICGFHAAALGIVSRPTPRLDPPARCVSIVHPIYSCTPAGRIRVSLRLQETPLGLVAPSGERVLRGGDAAGILPGLHGVHPALKIVGVFYGSGSDSEGFLQKPIGKVDIGHHSSVRRRDTPSPKTAIVIGERGLRSLARSGNGALNAADLIRAIVAEGAATGAQIDRMAQASVCIVSVVYLRQCGAQRVTACDTGQPSVRKDLADRAQIREGLDTGSVSVDQVGRLAVRHLPHNRRPLTQPVRRGPVLSDQGTSLSIVSAIALVGPRFDGKRPRGPRCRSAVHQLFPSCDSVHEPVNLVVSRAEVEWSRRRIKHQGLILQLASAIVFINFQDPIGVPSSRQLTLIVVAVHLVRIVSISRWRGVGKHTA